MPSHSVWLKPQAPVLKLPQNLLCPPSAWLNRVPTAQGKQGKWPKKASLSGKTQGIWKFCQNTGNFVCSSCKFPDAKGKGYCNICREKFPFFSRSWIGLPSQFCVCNSYKLWKLAQGKIAVGQGKHREFENTIGVGTLK